MDGCQEMSNCYQISLLQSEAYLDSEFQSQIIEKADQKARLPCQILVKLAQKSSNLFEWRAVGVLF